MNKLISSPAECDVRELLTTRLGLPIGNYCSHSSVVVGTKSCNDSKVFPILCPLQDGQPSESKRRNRKNCLYWVNGTMSSNRCREDSFRKLGSMVYPICKGVNCSRFEKPK